MKKFCVIGYPINHSKSPNLHNAGFREMEIDAEFTAIEVKPEDLDSWMKNEFPKYTGVAVTIPHKEKIKKYVDQETEAAQKIGAINTLYRNEGLVIGTNTDCLGALKAIQTELLNLKNKKVLILGAGGASRAIIFALQAPEMDISIWNRTKEKAIKLAEEFEINAVENLRVVNSDNFDLIVNATSVGLKEWKSPISSDFFSSQQVVFDIVYEPLETKFLSDAQAKEASIVTGDKMLVFQAIEQFKIWHGIELEPEVMGAAFFE